MRAGLNKCRMIDFDRRYMILRLPPGANAKRANGVVTVNHSRRHRSYACTQMQIQARLRVKRPRGEALRLLSVSNGRASGLTFTRC